jgi:hypothetical protein
MSINVGPPFLRSRCSIGRDLRDHVSSAVDTGQIGLAIAAPRRRAHGFGLVPHRRFAAGSAGKWPKTSALTTSLTRRRLAANCVVPVRPDSRQLWAKHERGMIKCSVTLVSPPRSGGENCQSGGAPGSLRQRRSQASLMGAAEASRRSVWSMA